MLRYEYLNVHCSSNYSSYLDLDISGTKNGRNKQTMVEKMVEKC